MQPPVFVLTGQLAAGKSTIGRAVLDQFEFGYYIDLDAIRDMVTKGLASPLEWTDETTRQFELSVTAAAALARLYSANGFAVAIEGAVDPESIERQLGAAGLDFIGVVLHPRLDVALARNRERQTKPFEPEILEEVMHRIDADLHAAGARADWHTIDNSDEDVAATVRRILALAS